MFRMRRPSSPQIERLLDDSRALPLSYTPAGLANFSRPRAALAALAFPYTRLLQARFRRDSALAVRRAVEGR